MKLNVQFLSDEAKLAYTGENTDKKMAWGLMDSGIDLRAIIPETVVMQPGDRYVAKTGIKVELDTKEIFTVLKSEKYGNVLAMGVGQPDGSKYWEDIYAIAHKKMEPNDRINVESSYKDVVNNGIEIQIRPRSGLAAKYGITVVNTPGTVDVGYRGELMVILLNTGKEPFTINPNDRIAQMVVCPIYKPDIEFVEEVGDTDRGEKGLGSSGVN